MEPIVMCKERMLKTPFNKLENQISLSYRKHRKHRGSWCISSVQLAWRYFELYIHLHITNTHYCAVWWSVTHIKKMCTRAILGIASQVYHIIYVVQSTYAFFSYFVSPAEEYGPQYMVHHGVSWKEGFLE